MLRIWVALHAGWGNDADGASMLEYAFLIALIAIVVVAAALFFGTGLSSDFSDVGDTMQAL